MRAGSLIHPVDVYRYIDQQSASGACSKVRTKLMSIRCALLRTTGNYVQLPTEETDKVSIVLQTWLIKDIKDSDTICWSCQDFKITLLEYDYTSGTMKIYCTKIIK